MAPSGSCGLASAAKEAGEPCTRSRECGEGLTCESGACRMERDGGGADAEVSDASSPDADRDL